MSGVCLQPGRILRRYELYCGRVRIPERRRDPSKRGLRFQPGHRVRTLRLLKTLKCRSRLLGVSSSCFLFGVFIAFLFFPRFSLFDISLLSYPILVNQGGGPHFFLSSFFLFYTVIRRFGDPLRSQTACLWFSQHYSERETQIPYYILLSPFLQTGNGCVAGANIVQRQQ